MPIAPIYKAFHFLLGPILKSGASTLNPREQSHRTGLRSGLDVGLEWTESRGNEGEAHVQPHRHRDSIETTKVHSSTTPRAEGRGAPMESGVIHHTWVPNRRSK
ncbi:hypothetical protein Nepgr_021456 [Nepenthes gracilis]|uniref:Uncharacterized protein n=1 Tax=Nepenthes gracilis TaxID=150966 RepID=A0AAD3SYP3_NEPGR|nr:hypothetical protein Nepgr_021456 [Nepenthes gracilis]